MEINITVGTLGKVEQTVDYEKSAASVGSGLLEVFATPAMITLMEKTCFESVQALLPEGFGTVGTKVNISHLKATPLNMKVTCESEVIEVNKKRLLFKVFAKDETGIIGEGLHERYIIENKKFMQKL